MPISSPWTQGQDYTYLLLKYQVGASRLLQHGDIGRLKYCWNCGAQLHREDAKFCSECGTDLTVKSDGLQRMPERLVEAKRDNGLEQASRKTSAKELGSTLEDNVASIFKSLGYTVEVRRRFTTESGTAEIDIVLSRGTRKRGVECKNYDPSRYIGIKELRDFKGRLDQVGIISGLFVTNTMFSREAEQYADSNGIETWDKPMLQEKLIAHITARDGVQRQETVVALPIVQPFDQASTLHLKNNEAVKLFVSLLIFHPYYLVKFRVYGRRKDPTGRTHKISDEGVCVIDALDGDIINREQGLVEGIGGLLKSKEEKAERTEDRAVAKDLTERPSEQQTPASTSDYQIKVLQPQISDSTAWKTAREYAIEKNSRVVHYQPKNSDDSLLGAIDRPSIKVVPKESEVSRRGESLVFVPKWDFQWETGEMTFQRRVIASSGLVVRDSMAKCAKCSVVHRSTVAVCETCGLPLCEKHAHEEVGAQLCAEHISDELKQKIKSESLVSKLFGRAQKRA